jgi:hypothetical protein
MAIVVSLASDRRVSESIGALNYRGKKATWDQYAPGVNYQDTCAGH